MRAGLPLLVMAGALFAQTPQKSSAQLEMELIQEKYQRVRDSFDRLDTIARLILTVNTLLTFGLGIGAWFGMSQIRQNAKEELDQLKAVVKKTETDFPVLTAALDRNVRTLLQEIPQGLDFGSLWDAKTYPGLSASTRNQFLFAEMRFASLEVFDLTKNPEMRPQIGKILHRLAIFYMLRYRAQGERIDWERARIYLERAVDISPKDPVMFKDTGVLQTWLEVTISAGIDHQGALTASALDRCRDRADSAFEMASNLDANEAGAWFGRGWIALKRGDLAAAEGLYQRIPDLQLSPENKNKYLSESYYNVACVASLRATSATDNLPLSRALAALVQWKGFENVKGDHWRNQAIQDADLTNVRRWRPTEWTAFLS